ncbi:MAG TPA: adenylate/guanylate cyclase domain-containing protein [Micromonosporaceae bacterium]|nr:adenylate/guanylate cyclase domain-containing protein [Micromonosporaceae bacterium]
MVGTGDIRLAEVNAVVGAARPGRATGSVPAARAETSHLCTAPRLTPSAGRPGHHRPDLGGGSRRDRRPREERRTVSVLFADIVGFTPLAGRLDPEDVRAFQNDYFRRVKGVVRQRGGVVEKYVGDAVLAVFGAPRSDGYDAYRAVRAGLDIQESLAGLRLPDGSPVGVRVGIATGEVVVDLDAMRDGGQALVSGEVVNIAARVQAYAAAGSVAVTAATRRATEPVVAYQQAGPVMVAGRSTPVEVWQAQATRLRPGAGVGEEAAPFVGRGDELSALIDRLRWILRRGVPQVLPVVGPAGIGKTRLVRELARCVRATSAGPVRWWFGQCPPCGGGCYEVLAEMLGHHAGVADSDDASTARSKLAAMMQGLATGEELASVLDVLVTLLRQPGPHAGEPAAEQAAPVLRRVLLAAAADQPLVLVVDDVDHADPRLAQFIGDLVAQAAAAPRPVPLAAVVIHRPDALPALSGWSGLAVPVEPLTAGEARSLLGHLLGRHDQPVGLADRLVPLAAGNPRYAEEYVRMLAERGAALVRAANGETPVPERVHGVVAAQLDQVAEADRDVLHAAAVIGEAVRPDAVAALLRTEPLHARAALRRLERRRLLARRTTASLERQPEYEFSQVVIRQVAYCRLPRAVRLDHHRAAAEWLESVAATGESSVDEKRARHWFAAFELARALRRDAEPYLAAARDALAAAARNASRAVAVDRARHLAGRAALPGAVAADVVEVEQAC